MALPPREVRYRKSAVYLLFGFLVFMILPIIGIFLSPFPKDLPLLSSLVIILLTLVLVGRWAYLRLSSPEPVLTFQSDSLVLHRKNKTIRWSSITEWKIRRDKSSHYLLIYTPEGRTRVDLSMLDHSMKDIKWLMESYILEPGPWTAGRMRPQ